MRTHARASGVLRVADVDRAAHGLLVPAQVGLAVGAAGHASPRHAQGGATHESDSLQHAESKK